MTENSPRRLKLLLLISVVFFGLIYLPGFTQDALTPARDVPDILEIDLAGKAILVLVKIQAGSFIMGSDDGDLQEKPLHNVVLTRDFYIGKFEVTQQQWRAVMGSNPAMFDNPAHPVEMISWEDALEFCQKLSQIKESRFRLPYEAEWEYACRAGSQGTYSWGEGEEKSALGDYSWYQENTQGQGTRPVGRKKPNSWGLHDMTGNVWEMCMDYWEQYYYRKSPENNPTGSDYGIHKIIRGGCWDGPVKWLRSANRGRSRLNNRRNSIGFRFVMEIE